MEIPYVLQILDEGGYPLFGKLVFVRMVMMANDTMVLGYPFHVQGKSVKKII